MDGVHDASHNQADADEQTRLWHPDGDLVVHVEPWGKRCEFRWIGTMYPSKEKYIKVLLKEK